MDRTIDKAQPTRSYESNNAKKIRLRDYTRRMGRLADRVSTLSGRLDKLNWEKLLGRYGTTMKWVPLSPAEAQYVEELAGTIYKRGLRAFRIKHCYQNCVQLLFADEKSSLNYCEGYANVGAGPFQHAWLTINEKVVDPTVDAADRSGMSIPYRAYFGIQIPRKQLLKLLKDGSYGPFITHHSLWQELKSGR